MANYITEREGQVEFYKTFLPLIDPSLNLDNILADDNDGVLNGNLLEFKLRINDLNAVLFQCVKYLSALRVKGKPVPANILIVDLNGEQAYLYKSDDYLVYIEKVYSGGASKSNSGFVGNAYNQKYDYSKPLDASKLIAVLKSAEWTKIHIDENCIVGWATAYYKAVPTARKEDFIGDDTGKHKTIGEIRNPSVFAPYIIPYTGHSNVRFQYLMDRLNDTLQKKNLGAFYTPEVYAEKSHELLRMAIDRVPEGNDYVIIDRCAGTGNLEKTLTDEELSHCILSTVEYYEYKVLQELLGAKVRHIVPPIEADDTFNAGLVRGADALSQEYIKNPVIKQYINDQKCTIILFENPPYAEAHGSEKKMSGSWKQSFLHTEMKKVLRGSVSDDVGNIFIWSGFKYYLRQPTDSYVVYSHVKYWKGQGLVQKKFLDGRAFNRRHFHTDIDACIMCALWANIDDAVTEELYIHGYDVDDNGDVIDYDLLPVKKIHSSFADSYYDKRKDSHDKVGVACYSDGLEESNKKLSLTPLYNDNIVCYLAPKGTGFDKPDLNCTLTTCAFYNAHGFYVRKDNYLEKLPMFCASRYITYNRAWTERARIMKSGDGADRYNADVASGKLDQWLRKCLLFTCLEMQNHMRTFTGSDGRFYRNELCLDTTNGDTLASVDLSKLNMNETEKQLMAQWNNLLAEAKKTAEYNSSLTYGVYQIFAEIDTSYKDEEGNTVWNNIEVHSALQTLKSLVKDYYKKEIVPTLFEYEFLK
ncbi:MAG: hypothetical protein K5756_02695 [Clostridiales bacterium]|nr:hypothetical protein [Clostridiales bacterium]